MGGANIKTDTSNRLVSDTEKSTWNGKANSNHSHTKDQITDFPLFLKNPTSIIIKLNGGNTEGTNKFTYDGIAQKTINITPSNIGAAAASHNHDNIYSKLGHTHSYLPLAGGTMTGRIVRSSGGSWISDRDNCAIYNSYTNASSYSPVVGQKTPNGVWTIGSLGTDNGLYFSYTTDSNYSAGTNTSATTVLNSNGIIITSANIGSYNCNYANSAGVANAVSWTNVSDKPNICRLLSDGSYWGFRGPDGNECNWIRTPSYGILPYTTGARGSGHSMIGADGWYFSQAYIDTVNAYQICPTQLVYGTAGKIFSSGNDSAYGPGWQLNNLVISSWWGVSFTCEPSGQTFSGKTAVGIDCREGVVKSNKIELSKYFTSSLNGGVAEDCALQFTGGTLWGLKKLSNELQIYTDSGTKFRFGSNCAYCDTYFRSQGIYDNTSSGTANVYISGETYLKRFSSATKYKLNIAPINEDNSYPYNILKLTPKQWFDKGETERYAEYLTSEYTGEEIDDEYKKFCLDGSVNAYYGLVAEDVESAGLSKFCEYGKEDEDGNREIEGIAYDKLPVLMIPILKDIINYLNIIRSSVKDSITDKDALDKLSAIESRFDLVANM